MSTLSSKQQLKALNTLALMLKNLTFTLSFM